MKVYTVYQTWECMDDYKASSSVIGVFANEADARACLKHQRDEELRESYVAWNLEGAEGDEEDEMVGNIVSDEPDYFEVEYGDYQKYDILEIEEKELK